MNKETIEKFYTAFQRKDWLTMQLCYHDKAVFSDPVFQNLSYKEVKAMWHMLVLAGSDLTIVFNNVQATEKNGSCHWDARYSFSRTGRKVHNSIEATFEFEGKKIISHADNFDLWKWSAMALGLPGKLLGWSPLIRNKIRANARKSLAKFVQEHEEYQ